MLLCRQEQADLRADYLKQSCLTIKNNTKTVDIQSQQQHIAEEEQGRSLKCLSGWFEQQLLRFDQASIKFHLGQIKPYLPCIKYKPLLLKPDASQIGLEEA